MSSAPLQRHSTASPLSPSPDEHVESVERRSPRPPTSSSPAGSPGATISTLAEKTIVAKPTKKSLAAHVASTIHFLATEVSARSGGPRSLSSASRGSSCVSEPPLTHARPPASPEEVEEQLDRILYAISQLQQLQRRRRYIAAREVRNLRRAFLFAVGEEQQYREAVAAEAEGASMTSAASSAPSTPSLRPKRHRRNTPGRGAGASCGTSQHLHRNADGAADGVRSTSPPPPSCSHGGDEHEGGPAHEDAAAVSTTSPGWLLSADQSTPATSLPHTRKVTEGGVEYSAKAAAADRLLCHLEQYVDQTPTSTSFDVNGAEFSWRSILHTPGQRRLQSLVMSLFIFFTGIPICCGITMLLMLSRYTAPLMVIYLVWIFTFGRPNYPHKKNAAFCRFVLWRYYRDYFPVRLVIPKPVQRRFDPERSYFFVYHPHGIHTFGALLNFGLDTNDVSEMLPGVTIHLQTLGVNLYVPFWRQLAIWMGCGDASASCIRKTLRSGPGESIMLVVGGAEESLMARPNANDLLLLKRKGFIKIALQEGTPLVPVYGFGENNVYNVAELASEPDVQHLLGLFKRYVGFAIPLVKGRGFFNFHYGLLPHRRPIVVVVGEPITVPRIAEPTQEDIDTWQARYIEGLQKLYDEHRGIYDLEATGLRIMR